jgi:hypothetical protein
MGFRANGAAGCSGLWSRWVIGGGVVPDLLSTSLRDRLGWRACERAMCEEAAALDPGDDPALRSFHDEGVRSLEIFGLVRRVIATATAP